MSAATAALALLTIAAWVLLSAVVGFPLAWCMGKIDEGEKTGGNT